VTSITSAMTTAPTARTWCQGRWVRVAAGDGRGVGMCLEDPLAVPRPRSRPVAASPGNRPVSARSWAGRWLPASRSPPSDGAQRSGPAAVSGAAPLVRRMHSHARTCSWWAIWTARITVRPASHRRLPVQVILSRAPLRNARSARAPVARAVSGSGGSSESAQGHGRLLRALGRLMRIRFITDLPGVIDRRARVLLVMRRSARIRQGECRAYPPLVSDRLVAVWSAWRCAGQGPADPFWGAARPGSDDPQAPGLGGSG
jgi:hypothetical protein